MYKYDGSKYHALTTIHELGHTLGLPHTFETSSSAKHQFYQGYTDNIMDYNDKLDPSGINQDIQLNEFYENNLASFKWQWDIIRNDRSIY
ncbi:zinc-dependent metalloprotease [Psychrobacter sp. FME13]|uniref:zinc-dependent metalloprotease n=1 Tax=Psychrobacter sp. FME13 TaxID=2487708 RepID=UPI001788699C|nr:zinc-dependent metalloprotease [Psychrobacter sp. FME13]MBE0443559.1 zinc-dependent metalloprotease [Psychrobacter sp. FME13]